MLGIKGEAAMELTYRILKDKQRSERDNYSSIVGLRIHRAISWIKAAERAQDEDTQFIHYWIAFNSAYAGDAEELRLSEKQQHRDFFRLIVANDPDKLVYKSIWQEFPNAIRVMLENKFVFESFWDFKRGLITEPDWVDKFESSKAAALRALGNENTELVLAVIFNRLYTLRNQIIHGGATWESSVNRAQIRDGLNILKTVVPIVVFIMMENYGLDWGSVRYPVLD